MAEPDGEGGLSGSELEVADIEAYAREKLKDGEVILGDRHDEADEAKDKRGVLNKPMLIRKLSDIEYRVPEGAKRVPWIDTLSIDGQGEVPKGVKAKDGVKLEGVFLAMASDAVKEAYRRLRVMKVPCSRPSDFYAEMMRPDKTMYKVRAFASEETRRIKIVEERKKSQAAKKFAKKARTKKLEARAAEKRNTLEEISEWRKQSKKDGKNADEKDLEDILSRNARNKDDGGKGQSRGKPKKSKKREAKDARFGFGGKKSGKKRNDARSTSDFSASPWAKKGKGKGKGKGPGGKGGGGSMPNRPGGKKRKR